MKIAVVSVHASPLPVLTDEEEGGQDVHVAELAAALAAQGHDVVVHTRRDSVRPPEVVRAKPGYEVVHGPAGPPGPLPADELPPHLDEFIRALHDRWRVDRPDVVHAHSWTSGLAAVLAASGLGVPVVQTFHALGALERRLRGTAVPSARVSTERLIAREATRVVATSSDELNELVRMGVPRKRVAVVPPAVDVSRFSPEGPRLNRPMPHRLVTPEDGAEEVIVALRGVRDTELVVVGGGPDEVRALRELAREHEVAERVRLLGPVPRVARPALLRSADAVVCTTWGENTAAAPLEAMACGVPVVASAVAGLAETVVDGVTGMLVPPNEPGALARALRPLLADEARRDAYGTAAADRVEARYRIDRIACEIARVYRQASGLEDAVEAAPDAAQEASPQEV
ncbi:glycosyltransferase [Saccharothrix syringae]|uniref:Glycosyltransferase n=1 Tax=Saccharothrix syringae TaxID=103733 RepID=A0A5Q0H684_SACSY|nr:glycosyltransferase [Saccharothrix syringae]QFZ21721.1 glycosyltransferase [Saccharothrix syringae]